MSDLISRQAAIDAIEPTLKSILQGNSFKAINVMDKIRELPPAQPKLEQNTHSEQRENDKLGVKMGETCADTISRLAAIDAVKCGALSAAMVYGRTDAGSAALSETIKAIKALPSAQPEIVRCKDCVYHAGWDYCEEVDGLWYDDDFCCHGEKGEKREE